MATTLEDIMAMLNGMNTRIETIQKTVAGHSEQITAVATTVTAMQDAQVQTATWQAQMVAKTGQREAHCRTTR